MRVLPWLAAMVALLSLSAVASPRPVIDIGVTDLITGETLPIYWHRGERWIAGKPGNRYSIDLRNRGPGRVLAVLSVDGVNAVTGETAAWDQSGYVLSPHQRAEIRGWRKSQERVAAFEFTALPDSYAARTGRPHQVGVIGVAVFREASPPVQSHVPSGAGSDVARDATDSPKAAEAGNVAGSSAPAAAAEQRREADSAARASRLGTGHGRSETSYVELTQFERAQARPDQILTIRYDSRANLIAMGVIPPPFELRPNPFPGTLGFVPDPPRR